MKPHPVKRSAKRNPRTNSFPREANRFRMQSCTLLFRRTLGCTTFLMSVSVDLPTLDTSISQRLLQAPLLTSCCSFGSVCQTFHGTGTRCFPVGFANCRGMMRLKQRANTAIWSWQTTRRSATRRHVTCAISIWQKVGSPE